MNATTAPPIAPAPYVTIPLAAIVTGLSEKAIRRKIEDGIFISIKGYASWVEQATG